MSKKELVNNPDKYLYNKKRIFNRWFEGGSILKKIKGIPYYFKQVHYLNKFGHDISATWEIFDWFTETMRHILTEYRKHHNGSPWLDANDEGDAIHDKWDAIVDRMIELLDLMDEKNPIYDIDFPDDEAGREEWLKITKENNEKMYAAKDEFFELFSKYFYHLWD